MKLRYRGAWNKVRGWIPATVILMMLPAGFLFRSRSAPDPLHAGTVFSGPLEVWSLYEGVLEARHMEQVPAPLDGSAVLIELVSEGAPVRAGDLLARFDMTEAEADRVRLAHERTRVATERDGLRDAELLLERVELEAHVFEAEHALEGEVRFLEAVRELAERGLVGQEEVERQETRVAGLKTRLHQARTRLDLTVGHVHPARLARVEAALASLDAQLDRVARRIENGWVRAPSDGVAVHLPLPLGGIFRTAQVGDTLHRNQVFLALPDMRDPVARFRIPESDLPRVLPGARARVRPLAFPDLVMEGTIEQVGAMAHAMPGEAARGKGFPVQVALPRPDKRLPAGITVRVEVLSYARKEAVQVPRSAVAWRAGVPEVRVVRDGAGELRPLALGWAGETTFEVIDGLMPGDRVEMP